MRNVVALALLGLGILTMPKGCDPGGAPKAHASLPSFVALQCAEVALTRDDVGPAPTPNNKVPRAQCTQCNGTGRIVHGDGHSTECTHCFVFFGPQQLEGGVPIQLARYPLTAAASLECDCERCKCSPCECAERDALEARLASRFRKIREGCSSGLCGTASPAGAGDCSSGSCGASAAGDCNSGSCGSSGGDSDGPRFTGPVRRAAGFFRERRPVRRFLGRLFGRRG